MAFDEANVRYLFVIFQLFNVDAFTDIADSRVTHTVNAISHVKLSRGASHLRFSIQC